MELIKCCKELMIREPFYGLFLLNLNKEISDTYVDTACVSRNGVNSKLVINPNYWDKLTDNQQLGLLKHELIHICFNHMFIESELRISDHKLFNIACDLVCDQYIKDVPDNMWDQLKDKYPDLVKNLEKDKGAKYYYEELIKYAQKILNLDRKDQVVGIEAQYKVLMELVEELMIISLGKNIKILMKQEKN